MSRSSHALARARARALGLCLLGASACGDQATDQYLGEPLLSMRGRVTVDAHNASLESVPALCFRDFIPNKRFPAERLPEAIRDDVLDLGRLEEEFAHIVDVESRGEFPAEFDVDVYMPPPSAALKAPFSGEPKSAMGKVCAVATDHPATASAFYSVQVTAPNLEGVVVRMVRVTADAKRFHSTQYDCPTTRTSVEDCEVTRDGDPSLVAMAGGYESVYGVDDSVMVIYLAEPAPAGSYTAQLAGSPEGLPAGYHLRAEAGFVYEGECTHDTYRSALDETNAQHGTSYDALPTYSAADGDHYAPPDVVDTFRRISARLELEDCPRIYRGGQAALTDLSIEIHAEEPGWSDPPPLPPPMVPEPT